MSAEVQATRSKNRPTRVWYFSPRARRLTFPQPHPPPQAPQHPYSDGFSRLRAPMEMSCASAASSWGDFLRTKCDVCSGALAKPLQGAQARLSTWCVSAYARAPPSSPSTAHLWGGCHRESPLGIETPGRGVGLGWMNVTPPPAAWKADERRGGCGFGAASLVDGPGPLALPTLPAFPDSPPNATNIWRLPTHISCVLYTKQCFTLRGYSSEQNGCVPSLCGLRDLWGGGQGGDFSG